MREKIMSIIQKVVVLFLALLMLITMMPVGLFPGDDTPSAEGDFARRLPSAEVSRQSSSDDETIRSIGKYNSVYYKFNISDLQNLKEDEIKEVTLRLAFLKGSGMRNNTVKISFVEAEDMPTNSEKISLIPVNENNYKIVKPDTSGNEDALVEIDVLEYAKSKIRQGRTELAIGISADMPVCIAMASQKYRDEAYRPCIKTVTGIAQDTDSKALRKAELKEVAYISRYHSNTKGSELLEKENNLLVGGGNEAYLKFDIDKAAIMGELYSARLVLRNKPANKALKIKVYLLNNNQWTPEEISYDNRPRGEETETMTVCTDGGDVLTVDVTQQLCEAVNQGVSTVTFRIAGQDDEIFKFETSRDASKAPKLFLKASDQKDIVCASEAALNALGNNRASFVTMNLSEAYSAQNGGSAKISWSLQEDSSDNIKSDGYITENGTVTRPKWYENDVEVAVEANISSGEYVTVRRYYLNIPAETAPDYSKYKFSNYIDIGSNQSEQNQKFEYKNVGAGRRRWVGGQLFSYRVPEKNATMVLNFACSPYETNYLTIKLWAEDSVSPGEINIIPCEFMGEEKKYTIPTEVKSGDDGFMYVTYALPKEFTDGKSSVSLRVGFDKYTNEASRGIYAAYMTQNPFFEPKQFEKQGEKTISGESFAEEAIAKFIENLRLIFAGVDAGKQEDAESETESVAVDEEANSIVFSGEDLNIAFKINNEDKTASIYQRTGYFDRFCADCKVEDDDGVVSINFGPYVLLWNRSEKELSVEKQQKEFSGIYKGIPNGIYYNFSEEWQLTDDSVVPTDGVVVDGKTLLLEPKSPLILRHISEPMSSAEWRVSMINGKSVSEVDFAATEKIEEIKVKAVGGISENAKKLTMLLMMYDDGKLASVKKIENDLYNDIYDYSFDFSGDYVYMTKDKVLKLFVYDNTEEVGKILPKAELPQTGK